MSNRSKFQNACCALLVLSLGLFSQMPLVHAGTFSSDVRWNAPAVGSHCEEHVPSDGQQRGRHESPGHHGTPNGSDANHCVKTVIETGPCVSHPSVKDLFVGIAAVPVWKIETPSVPRCRSPWQGGHSPPENRRTAFVKENRRRI